MENEKKLTRSSNRMIAGVCAGIAEYFGWVQRLTECILPEQRQQHVLGHHELVIEEPSLLHGIVHQNTHISG